MHLPEDAAWEQVDAIKRTVAEEKMRNTQIETFHLPLNASNKDIENAVQANNQKVERRGLGENASAEDLQKAKNARDDR